MPANYVLLERIELNASAASIVFSNIPQSGYTDLKVVINARSDRAANQDTVIYKFNSSASSYSYRQLYGGAGGGGIVTGSASGTPAYQVLGVFPATNNTASTFGNQELYIPNYAGSTNKSTSSDSVAENNAATHFQLDLIAGLWSNTAAITSIQFTTENAANFVQYSTFSLYGLAAVGTTPAIAPKASGGNIQTDGTYWYHTFLSTGAFVPQTGLTCDYLVVAGGGGGSSGGGGAGGFRVLTAQSLTTSSYTAVVGGGGAGQRSDTLFGTDGVASSFNSASSSGGGGGGGAYGTSTRIGRGGGSGGGSAKDAGSASVGAGNAGSYSPSEGNNGGAVTGAFPPTGWGSAGGGGAGAVGGNGGSSETAGAGGSGSITYSTWASATSTGVSGYYAGGGGGTSNGGAAGAGGAGGGGAGGVAAVGVNGTANTGGGGGGSFNNATPSAGIGGTGGSGIVIIRYPIA